MHWAMCMNRVGGMSAQSPHKWSGYQQPTQAKDHVTPLRLQNHCKIIETQ